MARNRVGRPPGVDGDDTRRQLLDVARRQVGERGYAKATLNAISREAGVSSSAVYYYFDSKQQLVNELIVETHKEILDRFRAAASTADTLPAKLVAVFSATLESFADNPDVPRFALAMRAEWKRYPELDEALARTTREYYDFFHSLAAEAAARGELAEDLHVQQIADMCSMMSLGLTDLAVRIPPERRSDAISAVNRLFASTAFANGLTAEAGSNRMQAG